MRELPLLAPAGCTLSPEALGEQFGRAARLAPAVRRVSRTATGLRVEFGPTVDAALVGELIATERSCCSFLELDYSERVLGVASDDPRGAEIMDRLAAYFEGGR
jgi:hypothetical protein